MLQKQYNNFPVCVTMTDVWYIQRDRELVARRTATDISCFILRNSFS